ncbi:hypothetical protein AgCh_033929 [Apium graveolens]
MGNLLCCVKVDQSTVAIKEQFGKFSHVLDPGCHCLPWSFGYRLAVIRGGTVPKLNLDDAFEQKTDIAKAVEEQLEKAMSHYGFEIVETLIVDEHVKKAMNELNAELNNGTVRQALIALSEPVNPF